MLLKYSGKSSKLRKAMRRQRGQQVQRVLLGDVLPLSTACQSCSHIQDPPKIVHYTSADVAAAPQAGLQAAAKDASGFHDMSCLLSKQQLRVGCDAMFGLEVLLLLDVCVSVGAWPELCQSTEALCCRVSA
jgi:hypothetical protein